MHYWVLWNPCKKGIIFWVVKGEDEWGETVQTQAYDCQMLAEKVPELQQRQSPVLVVARADIYYFIRLLGNIL